MNEAKTGYAIMFNATQMGNCSCKDVAFKNVGKVATSVILEILDDTNDVFSLVPKPDTVKLIKLWSSDGLNVYLFPI